MSFFKKKLGNLGFTLVELIVTIAVLGAIVVPVGTMFIANTIRYYQENKKIAVSSDSLIACNKIFDHLRQATQSTIVLTNNGKQVNFEIGGKAHQIYYEEETKRLLLAKEGQNQVLLSNVTLAQFSEPQVGRISFSLTIQAPMPFQEDYIYQRTYDYTKRT